MTNGQRPKISHVCQYVRFRFGRQEHVCAHWRSLPRPRLITRAHYAGTEQGACRMAEVGDQFLPIVGWSTVAMSDGRVGVEFVWP